MSTVAATAPVVVSVAGYEKYEPFGTYNGITMTKKWHMVNRYNLLRCVVRMPQLKYWKAKRINMTNLQHMVEVMEQTIIVQEDIWRITPAVLQDLVDEKYQ
jgi:hypothetical protein